MQLFSTTMKYPLKTLATVFIFCFTTSFLWSQNTISLTIENIPKIETKINKDLGGMKSISYQDKSPIVSYKLPNQFKPIAIPLKQHQKRLQTTIDADVIYLTLRYNVGKTKFFMIQRGDIATIEYSDGIPYIDIQNRTRKKHDEDITELLNTLDVPLVGFKFYRKHGRSMSKKDKKEAFDKMNKVIPYLDSLSQNGLLSDVEYQYYRRKTIYERELLAEQFNTALLTEADLHVEGFELFMRQYVFGNLKKKIISLGNGMARNSLESFDFTLPNTHFSEHNKKYLLNLFLRSIRRDFSKKTYASRQQKYQSMYGNKNKVETKDYSEVYDQTANVLLVDSQGNQTTLQNILKANKGKVVYLDFWASWCAPCRKAFPAYKTLKKDYAEKDITFVFISGDRDADRWKRAEIKEKLTNSYLATNYPEAPFYEQMNLRRFPRYLIFDAKGQLVRAVAPGPNSDNIKSFLDELLDE